MTTYYVSASSSGSGNGSASSPFHTISEAMSANLKAGDEVVVKPGTYNESINFDKGGSAAADITLRSEVPGAALIRPPAGSYTGISVNANYVTIDGFDIKGGTGDGIEANNVHHVSVLNNKVHDSGESGIQFNYSDFIKVEGNETYNNASSGWFSGISLYENRNITGDTSTTGYRNIVQNNISHDNITKSGAHTDGNGIIIDDFQSTQTDGHPNYTFKTLVDNNLVYENGGKGIQVTWSDSVTVTNNTAYHNNQDAQNTGTWRGELSNSASNNNTWANNIAVADPSLNKNNTAIDNTSTDGPNSNVVWANNITYNGTAGQASVKTDGGNAMPSTTNGNQLGIDPKFLGAATGNFHLASGSAAIDHGTTQYGVDTVDLDGHARVVGTVDVGAYESGSSSAPGTPTTPTQPGTPTTPTQPGTPTTPTQPGTPTTPTQPGTPTTPTKEYIGTNGNDIMPHTGQSNGGNETFKGLGGNDVVKGGAGADVLDGGTGNDTATYEGSSSAVNVNLATGAASGGHAAGDKIVSIENLTGSSYDDVLTGGNGGSNILHGGAGADKLNGGAGGDVLDGGTGNDTASYEGSSSAVKVNLATGAASGGYATGDKFMSIENLTGSSYNDVLTGNSGSNVLHGGDGKDILTGGASSDTFAFNTPAEAGSGTNRDIITDFQKGIDKIDFSAMDANGSLQGTGTFHFQAQENALFDHKAGALAWHYDDKAGATVIQGDLNGDGIHDFEVQLHGHVQLAASDLIL
ncbi:M10 family metallopeptidase C-terminal domain-containing protein [Rhizobium sp. Pop5]|uniref:M10 family metallopeptidase C-terminal domain-containing protein n=1 Tax=Rhizobium sp. Pop5 TaxID=1223565 RepID=UPI00028385D8|nr:M10 family metallopeptidase C-terminal domain-containing protein [Rhizobium sp. Pop5]EJZ21375.1 hemolysin-type calcium-binding protein [Rhizobium sp. Pop5]UVD58403.1 M10 family metallopeptidase C-terminal domain-containing protein [Rhizobium sp. Pop5]